MKQTNNAEHVESDSDFNPANFHMYWTAQISPFMASLLVECYTRNIEEKYKVGFKKVAVFSNGTKSTCYLRDSERKKFAEFVIHRFAQNTSGVDELCRLIKEKADHLVTFCRESENNPSVEQYYRFKELFLEYNFYHITPRHLADFLGEEKVKPYMQVLSEARTHVEKLHYGLDLFLAKLLSGLLNINKEDALKYTFKEIESALSNDGSLDEVSLNEFTDFCIISRGAQSEKVSKDRAIKIFSLLNKVDEVSEIKGTTAFRGMVTGKVRIVIDPSKVANFEKGDILVAEMTRPEYVSLMDKASAIVTDGGGMLCHAAIVARELKKPCIIGTKNATRVLKDGYIVEVDADNGIVKILGK